MTTKKLNSGGLFSPFNWQWAAMIALVACFMADRAAAGTLTVSMAPLYLSPAPPTPINLSAEGDLDWAHYGRFLSTDYDHKAGVTPQIGNPTQTGVLSQYIAAAASCSWVDGAVEQTVTGTASGTFIYPAGSAYQWIIPASTVPVVLHFYMSTYLGGADLTFTLSDGSAPAVVTNILANAAERVTVTFAANSAAQTLTVNYAVSAGSGNNIALMAASLSSAAALPLNVPQPQLVNGTVLTTGSIFDVKANPTGVAADGSTAFAYQWQVSYNGGGYTDIAGATNNPLVATAGAAGNYNYRVVVTNSVLASAVTSVPTATLTVTTPTGTLGVYGQTLPPLSPTPRDINLSTEGVTDWAYWGLTGPGAYDTRANIIGNFTQIGSDGELQILPGSDTSYTWTDATTADTTASQTTVTAGMILANGYELDTPAQTTARVLNLYIAVQNAYAHIQVSMSDNSAPLFVDDPTTTTGTLRYTIAYSAATTGKTLKVQVTQSSRAAAGGLVALQAASLEPIPALSVSSLVVSPSTTVLVNQTVVLSLQPFQPTGAPPFSFVWQRDTGTGYTNMSNTGSSLTYQARSTVGTDNVRLIVTSSQGSVTSAPVVLSVNAITSTLGVIRTGLIAGTNINLTAEGLIDWKAWGNGGATGVDHKLTGGSIIGDFTLIGTGSPISSSPPIVSSWSDGTPNLTGSHNGGIKMIGAGNGYEVDVPAASYERVFRMYNSLNSCTMHFDASMSDNGAYPYTDESWTGNGNNSSCWTVRYSSSTPGAYLKVRFWDLVGTQVVLDSSTLTYGTITMQAQQVGGGLQITWPVGSLQSAPSVTGPWSTIVATSPYTVPTTGSSQGYFRVIAQ